MLKNIRNIPINFGGVKKHGMQMWLKIRMKNQGKENLANNKNWFLMFNFLGVEMSVYIQMIHIFASKHPYLYILEALQLLANHHINFTY